MDKDSIFTENLEVTIHPSDGGVVSMVNFDKAVGCSLDIALIGRFQKAKGAYVVQVNSVGLDRVIYANKAIEHELEKNKIQMLADKTPIFDYVDLKKFWYNPDYLIVMKPAAGVDLEGCTVVVPDIQDQHKLIRPVAELVYVKDGRMVPAPEGLSIALGSDNALSQVIKRSFKELKPTFKFVDAGVDTRFRLFGGNGADKLDGGDGKIFEYTPEDKLCGEEGHDILHGEKTDEYKVLYYTGVPKEIKHVVVPGPGIYVIYKDGTVVKARGLSPSDISDIDVKKLARMIHISEDGVIAELASRVYDPRDGKDKLVSKFFDESTFTSKETAEKNPVTKISEIIGENTPIHSGFGTGIRVEGFKTSVNYQGKFITTTDKQDIRRDFVSLPQQANQGHFVSRLYNNGQETKMLVINNDGSYSGDYVTVTDLSDKRRVYVLDEDGTKAIECKPYVMQCTVGQVKMDVDTWQPEGTKEFYLPEGWALRGVVDTNGQPVAGVSQKTILGTKVGEVAKFLAGSN